MRTVAGVVCCAVGLIGVLVFGVWGLVLAVRLLSEAAGLAAAVVAVVLFPLTLIVVPWFALAVRGDWTLLLVTYLGGGVALAVLGAAAAVVVSHLGTASGYGKPRRRLLPFLRGAREP